LVAVLFGFGFTAYHLERARQLGRIDAALQERLSALVVALRTAKRTSPQSTERTGRPQLSALPLTPALRTLFDDAAGHYFVVWMRDSQPILQSEHAPTNLPRPQTRDTSIRMRGNLRESFLFAAPVDCVLVGRSVAAEQRELHTLATLFGTVGGAILVAGLLGGWWLASRAIRPVEAIGATAEKIAAGDLGQRIISAETDSELGRLAIVLNATFARLDAAFTQQARFTADAAHELRTPLTVVLTHTQNALASPCPNEEHREALEATQRAAQRMRRLIDSLLELARLDAGQEPLRRAECDFAKIVAEGVALIRPLAVARKIAIHTTLPSAPCKADAERLAQVVTNLLSNAIEHNIDGGEVRVETAHHHATVALEISNSGTGIAADDLPHIFDRFQRGDKVRTDGGSHSGLGLAIAEAIVKAHGGAIKARSRPGSGATFIVTLPI
jgi:heavy metal sensor kinase